MKNTLALYRFMRAAYPDVVRWFAFRVGTMARPDLVRHQVSVIFTGGGLARLPGCDRWKIGVAFDGLFAHMFAAVEQKYRESDSD